MYMGANDEMPMLRVKKPFKNHWGRVTHICVNQNQVKIGSNNGVAPIRRQAIIWTKAGIL